MTANLKRYPEYKATNLDWLPEVPRGWEVKRFSWLFDIIGKGLNITKADLTSDGKRVISYGQIHSKINQGTAAKEELFRFVPESLANDSAKLTMNDFVFADTSEDLEGCGNCFLLDKQIDAFAGYHTIIVRLNNDDNCAKYLAYQFKSDFWRNQVRSAVSGVKVYSVTNKILKDTSLFLPCKTEQQKIVRFLDGETRKIDALINAKKREAALLAEYKRAFINKCVTKGLDDNAPMKDSGVEWLGKVPRGWEVKNFSRIFDIIGKGLNITKADLISNGKRVISYGQIHSKINQGTAAKDELFRFVPESLASDSAKLTINDFVFADTSEDLEGCGNCFLLDKQIDAFAGYCTIIVRLNNDDNCAKYLAYQFKSDFWRNQVRSSANSVKVYHVTNKILKDTSLLLPRKTEQQKIARFLDTKLANLDLSLLTLEKQIALLAEYKARLVSDVVTGQIDVRGLMADEA